MNTLFSYYWFCYEERCLPTSFILNLKTSEKYSIVFRSNWKKQNKTKQNISCLVCLVCVSSLLPKYVALSRCFTKDSILQTISWANTKPGICRYFPEKVKGPIKVMTFWKPFKMKECFLRKKKKKCCIIASKTIIFFTRNVFILHQDPHSKFSENYI